MAETVLQYNPAKTKSLREVISLVQVGEIDIVTFYVDSNRRKWTWQNWKLEKLKDGWHEKNWKRTSNKTRPEELVFDSSTKKSFTLFLVVYWIVFDYSVPWDPEKICVNSKRYISYFKRASAFTSNPPVCLRLKKNVQLWICFANKRLKWTQVISSSTEAEMLTMMHDLTVFSFLKSIVLNRLRFQTIQLYSRCCRAGFPTRKYLTIWEPCVTHLFWFGKTIVSHP